MRVLLVRATVVPRDAPFLSEIPTRPASRYVPDVSLVLPALLTVLVACADPPEPLPTEQAVAEVDRAALPALYRRLYDYAFLPEVQHDEQRVRLLIWLRAMDFNRFQLARLEELAATFARERAGLEATHAAIVAEHEPRVREVYGQLWDALRAGAPDAELDRLAQRLDAVRVREAELLTLRSRSVRTLLELERPFLDALTGDQSTRLADATFLLRHRLDPYANPGDFAALVGTVATAGQFGVLTRPTFDPNEDHLDIGRLWTSAGTPSGAAFPELRAEVVLYMVLLEPALPEAIAAARSLRATGGSEEAKSATNTAAEPAGATVPDGATRSSGAGAVPAPVVPPGE